VAGAPLAEPIYRLATAMPASRYFHCPRTCLNSNGGSQQCILIHARPEEL
jgi:hypothetical protein